VSGSAGRDYRDLAGWLALALVAALVVFAVVNYVVTYEPGLPSSGNEKDDPYGGEPPPDCGYQFPPPGC